MEINELDYEMICYPHIARVIVEWRYRVIREIDTHERDEEMRPGHPNEGKVPSELCGEDCWCREKLHPVYNPAPWDEDERREYKYDPQESLEMEFNRKVGIEQESLLRNSHD